MGRKIGELAAATGLTIRTLHYYEEIGLLPAAGRTNSGHRVYGDQHVERIYRILLLRRLGLSLDDITRALSDRDWDLRTAMTKHVGELDTRIEAMGRLRAQLGQVLAGPHETNANDLLRIVEDMNMLDNNTVQRRISILIYADIEGGYEYLVRVFGLGRGKLTRDPQGSVVHGELHAGDGVVWLHPESTRWRLASPRSVGSATAMMAVMVDDVDAHYRHAKDQGAVIDYEPVDQPYGYREYSAHDHEGGMWSFMKPIACSESDPS
jgi:MerR family transcriptional regulator, thiopeptide resistance regulator